jgi:hypothetical protein
MPLNQHEEDVSSPRATLLRAEEPRAQEQDAYWRARSRPKLQALDPGEAATTTTPPAPSVAVLVVVSASVACSWVLTTELSSAAQAGGFGSCALLYASTSLLSVLEAVPAVRRTRLQQPAATTTPGGGGLLANIGPAGFLVLWMGANLSFLAALTLDPPSTVGVGCLAS